MNIINFFKKIFFIKKLESESDKILIRKLVEEMNDDPITTLNLISKDNLRKIRKDMNFNETYYKNKYGGKAQSLYNLISDELDGSGCD